MPGWRRHNACALTFPIITAPEPPRESKTASESLFPPSNGQSPRRRDILITCRFAPASRPISIAIIDIDGTITSVNYLHVERTGEGVGQSWKLDERPLQQVDRGPIRSTMTSAFP